MTGIRLLVEPADQPEEGFVVILNLSGNERLRSKPIKSRMVAKELVYVTASQIETAVQNFWSTLQKPEPDPIDVEREARRQLRQMAGMPE